MRETLGNIVGGGEQIGRLTHDRGRAHTLLALDIEALVGACRGAGGAVLNARCIPLIEVVDPPFIDASDIQICGPNDKRHTIGYVWSMDGATGQVIYQVRFTVEAVLKLYGTVWAHCHLPTSAEMEARIGEKK